MLLRNKCSAVADMGGGLATTDMGRKLEAMPLLGGRQLGPHLTQCGRGLYLHAKFYLEGLCPLYGGGWIPFNIMSPVPRHTSYQLAS